MNQNNSIKINKTEIEQRKVKLALQMGVIPVSSNIVDESDICGWRMLTDVCAEVDIVRKYLCESEALLVENIETFDKTWSDLDKTIAEKM